MPDLRAQAFSVAHVTGEKRPVVFLHVAEAEVKRLRDAIRAALDTMNVTDRELGEGGVARRAYADLHHAYFAPSSEEQR